MVMSILLVAIALIVLAVPAVQTARSLCTNNRHKTGFWKLSQQFNISKSFFCCDIYGGYLNDTALCGTDKMPVRVQVGSSSHLAHVTGHACSCDRDPHSVYNRERYEWVPEYCSLLPWNASQFCGFLGNRSILFFG